MESSSGMNKRYLIREFHPSSDLEDAYACYIGSFYHTEWPLVDGADPQFIKDNILLMHYMGSKTFVAEADGGARGILVGLLRPRLALAGRVLALNTRIFYRLITGRYRMNTLAKKHCFQHVRGFFAVYLSSSPQRSGNLAFDVAKRVPWRYREGTDGCVDSGSAL